MASPIVTIADNVLSLSETVNSTGSSFVHWATKSGVVTHANPFADLAAYHPNPPLGSLQVSIRTNVNFLRDPPVRGVVEFKFSVADKLIDFLREGQVTTRPVDVRIRDDNSGDFVDRTILVRITGANDKPTARADLATINENIASHTHNVLANDTDPDIGDIKALTPGGFLVSSVTSTAAPFLTPAMVAAARVNLLDNKQPIKDSIQVVLKKAFQALNTGEKALVIIKYGMIDGFGATSASEFRLTVTGTPDAQIVGTTANDAALFGENDADQMFGLAGNDVIDARGGNDVLIGGAGQDRLKGGAGNDVFVLENGFDSVEDTGGIDTITSTITRNLVSYPAVENLILLGAAAVHGFGNAAANVITGNGAANNLGGAAGNDTLSAGGGNDWLNGGAGNDRLSGGAGLDNFVLDAALSATTNVDTIVDFDVPRDTIRLDNAVMAGLGPTVGVLAPGKFWKSATGFAHDLDDRIIYEIDSGRLVYDANGIAAGGAMEIARLAPNLALSNVDFVVM